PGYGRVPELSSVVRDLCDGPRSGCVVRQLLSDHPSAAVMSSLPVYHDESMQLRDLVGTRATDDRWTWTREGDKGELCWYPLSLDGKPRRPMLIRSMTDVPSVPRPMSATRRMALAAVALLLAAALSLLVRWLATRIFGLGRRRGRVSEIGERVRYARGVFALKAEAPNVCPEGVVLIDLRDREAKLDREALRARLKDAHGVVVTHLEARMQSQQDANEALSALETLLFEERKPVVLISE